MTQSQRIILNTAATYGRSLFGMALGLFSSRWVLEALGQSDFGLFSLVGSVIVFITFLNGVMSSSVSRHYAFALGKASTCIGEDEKVNEVRQWFNTALSIHLILPLILILIGYPIGIWCIENFFVIPEARIDACRWVFRISLISAFVNMASVPFVSMYVAKQLIAELSVFGFISTSLTFFFAFSLLYVPYDKLITYACYGACVAAGVPLMQCARAYFHFKECRVDFSCWFNKQRIKELCSFAGWQLFGGSGALLRAQGTAILINKYFGPTVNAAYGVSNTLVGQTQSLSGSLIGAFTPALSSAEGAGDRKKMIAMAFRACKFGTLLVLLFAIPLLVEIDFVLLVWLKTPPLYTAELCSLMIIMLLIDKVTVGHMVAITAQGKIAAYQMVLGTSLIATLPIAWAFVHFGFGVVSIGWAFIITMTFCSLGRVFFCKRQLEMSPFTWVKKVVVPVGLAGILSGGAGKMLAHFLKPSLTRALCVGSLCSIVLGITGWLLVLDTPERRYFAESVRKIQNRFFR